MYKKINPINIVSNEPGYRFEYPTPGVCPICDTGTDAQVLTSFYIQRESLNCYVFILFFCHSCEACFMGVYQCPYPSAGTTNRLSQIRLIPAGEEVSYFSDRISSLSPKFVEIYNQAEKAEQWGLSEICGMGYRKALEFLVKDFAILMSPESEETIKTKQLSPCINDYIDNKRIKALAKASAWIGNDETHYTRKHESYTTDDLKSFVTAMVTFIDSELAFMDAEQFLRK